MSNPTAITLSAARERGAISVEQTAHLLGIGRQTAYASVRDGTLPSIRVRGRVLVPVAALLRLLGEATSE